MTPANLITYDYMMITLNAHSFNTAPFFTGQKPIETGDDALSNGFCPVENGAVLKKLGTFEIVVMKSQLTKFAGHFA